MIYVCNETNKQIAGDDWLRKSPPLIKKKRNENDWLGMVEDPGFDPGDKSRGTRALNEKEQ